MMANKVKVWGGIGEKKAKRTNQWSIQDRIYDSNFLCPALTNFCSDYWVIIYEAQEEKE